MFLRTTPGAFVLGLTLVLAGGGAALPQDQSEDEELRKLREEADREAGDDAGEPAGEVGDLRRDADYAMEDEGPLYQQLLDSFSSVANRLNAFNPRLTVFGDILARISASSAELVEDGVNRDDRIAVREVEVDFRADIDPYAKGVLIIAAEEEEPGDYGFTIEEGYITLETLPWGFRAQAGRFRVPFGRINRLHTHDLPQATRPYMLTDVFGEEGYVENGAFVTWLAPFAAIELYAGIVNGENDGVLAGGDSDDPAYFARAEYFLQITQTMYVSVGASYLFGFNDQPGVVDPGTPSQETHLFGADLLFKWQPSQYRSLVIQGEVFGLEKEVGGRDSEYAFGGYGFVQVQPLHRWFAGVRYDYSDYSEGAENTNQYAIGAWVSFYTTEFLRFRLGYEHRERATTNGGDPDLDTVYIQITFVFGSHPVEPFWFNK